MIHLTAFFVSKVCCFLSNQKNLNQREVFFKQKVHRGDYFNGNQIEIRSDLVGGHGEPRKPDRQASRVPSV